MDAEGEVALETVTQGDTVQDVLGYVCFEPEDLLAEVRRVADQAVLKGRFSRSEADCFIEYYRQGLADYTYLESSDSSRDKPES